MSDAGSSHDVEVPPLVAMWAQEEDLLILHLVAQMGKKWSQIANNLPGRTDNGVRNRWNRLEKAQMIRKQHGTEHGYRCRRCGQPKRGHICPAISLTMAADGTSSRVAAEPGTWRREQPPWIGSGIVNVSGMGTKGAPLFDDLWNNDAKPDSRMDMLLPCDDAPQPHPMQRIEFCSSPSLRSDESHDGSGADSVGGDDSSYSTEQWEPSCFALHNEGSLSLFPPLPQLPQPLQQPHRPQPPPRTQMPSRPQLPLETQLIMLQPAPVQLPKPTPLSQSAPAPHLPLPPAPPLQAF